MSLSVTIAAMLASGCSPEQIAEVVFAHEKAQEEIKKEKRAKRAAQKRLERERAKMSPDVVATVSDSERHEATTCDISSPSSPSPNGFSPTTYKINTTPSSFTPTSTPSPLIFDHFSEFWAIYPRKIGKGQALKAFRAALKKTDAETITAAVKVYPWPADREFIPHASTWLNGERWADETTPLAKPKDTFRIGHPKGLVKPEPESAPLTEEQKAERARFVEQALKGFTGRAKALGESIG